MLHRRVLFLPALGFLYGAGCANVPENQAPSIIEKTMQTYPLEPVAPGIMSVMMLQIDTAYPRP